jgi:hypothetical protein
VSQEPLVLLFDLALPLVALLETGRLQVRLNQILPLVEVAEPEGGVHA